MKKTIFRTKILFFILGVGCLIWIFPSGCALYDLKDFIQTTEAEQIAAAGDSRQVLHTESELILAWDAAPPPVSKYRVFFRNHGSGSWIQLAEIDATGSPQYTIIHSDLDDGEYDFGITAVDEEARQSDIHCSLDPTASPATGWYVKWITE